MARARAALLLAVALAGPSACIDREPFACDDDEQCRGLDGKGSCEAPGYCANLDEGCVSGLRFGRFAAPALAGRCIEAVDETGPTSSSSEGMSTSPTAASTTAASSSSSGEPTPLEECDGVDNDGDGLIDEWSPLNDDCNGCALHQRLGYASALGPWIGAQRSWATYLPATR